MHGAKEVKQFNREKTVSKHDEMPCLLTVFF